MAVHQTNFSLCGEKWSENETNPFLSYTDVTLVLIGV